MILLVLAGGFGAAARFLVDDTVRRRRRGTVPIGTVVINLSACLLIGILTGWVAGRSGLDAVASVLGVGFLGGYSTFSTASVEGARLLLDRRWGAAVTHALGMLLGCLLAAWTGLALGGLMS